MKIPPESLNKLLSATVNTAEQEITCEQCAEMVNRYIEFRVTGSTTIPDDLQEIEQHLKVCAECFEVVQAIIAAMLAESDSSAPGDRPQ